MNSTMNAHFLLKGRVTDDGLLDKLAVPKKVEDDLHAAKNIIRRALRAAFDQVDQVAKQAKMHRFANDIAGAKVKVSPRFRIQGSFAYKTANSPAHQPPQQVDLDDGVYLPLSFVNEASGNHPRLAAKDFFDFVEAVLEPVCKQQKWELNPGKKRPTCVRVKISDVAHIDLPLYSIPDKDFLRVTEAAKLSLNKAMDGAVSFAESLSDAEYHELSKTHIMLAIRPKDGEPCWKSSDPSEIEGWFNKAVDRNGNQLLRICRYLKAWRDYHWKSGGISSIALMASAADIYDSFAGRPDADRDDIALLLVVEQLPTTLIGPIENPATETAEALDADLSDQDRAEYRKKAAELYEFVKAAIVTSPSKQTTFDNFRKAFGMRIPENEKLVEQQSQEATIKAFPAVKTTAPAVGASRSGTNGSPASRSG